jgi:ribosome-binding protein aMBF1 (putative translation factor)
MNTKSKQHSEPESHTSLIIQEIKARRDPSKMVSVRRQMHIATLIDDGLKAKGWSQRQLAINMGKRPSEITKWLSGTHNFTLETLSVIEKYLGITLIIVPEQELHLI